MNQTRDSLASDIWRACDILRRSQNRSRVLPLYILRL